MAHNKDRIPWDTLRLYHGLHGRQSAKKANAAVDDLDERRARCGSLKDLIAAIVHALHQDIIAESARYQPREKGPEDDEIIVSATAALRITPMVNLWRTKVFFAEGLGTILEMGRKRYDRWQVNAAVDDVSRWKLEGERAEEAIKTRLERNVSNQLCTHDMGFRCRCTLPRFERTAAAFKRPFEGSDCYEFMETCTKEYFGSLVMQSLIITGDMQPFFDLGDRNSEVFSWYMARECGCVTPTMGWGFLQETCLWSYMILNTLLTVSGREMGGPQIKFGDYRNLSCYKQLLDQVYNGDYLLKMHSDFYDADAPKPSLWERIPLPLSPEAARATVHAMSNKGLPSEIVQEILRYLELRAPIHVPGDPLQMANRQAVKEYLDLCWGIIVRCGVLRSWKEPGLDYSRDIGPIIDDFVTIFASQHP